MFSFQVHHPTTNTAIIADDGTRLTYGDLSDFSGSVNKVIPNRCLVFLLCRNTPGALCGYFSFLTGRIVPLMLDSTINGALLAGLIKTYKPQYLWLPDHRADEFLPAKTVFSGYRYSLVKLETNEGFPLHDDLAMLLATSGSTGSPKFVRISYENIVANAESIAGYLAIGENERPVTTLPMSYSYGLSVINSHILMGATILLTSKTLLEKDFWRFVKEHKASSLSGVPYMYKILKRINFMLMRKSHDALDIFDHDSGIVFISLGRDFTAITKISKNFLRVFGYSNPSEIIGKTLDFLMPQIFGMRHSSFIRSFVDSGKGRFLVSNLRNVFAVNKQGFVMEIQLLIRLDTVYHDEFVIAAYLKLQKNFNSNW